MAAKTLLIDGRSGSGKTELAAAIAAVHGARVVHMDDLYRGWDGLAAGSELLVERILEPLAAGLDAQWQRWDWVAECYREHDEHPAGRPLIVEGCGAITAATTRFSSASVWLEVPERVRRLRVLRRDGDDSWWEAWRAQEDAHIARNRPRGLAERDIMTA